MQSYENNLKAFLVLFLLVIIAGALIVIYVSANKDAGFMKAGECYAILFTLYIICCTYLFKL